MVATYSSIKAASEPEAMAEILAQRVLAPALSAVQVRKVKAIEGRRLEAPRILWNVYRADLELPGGVEMQRVFWTKAFFREDDLEKYRQNIGRLLAQQNGNPLDPKGFAQYFQDLNLFLFFFPIDPAFHALPMLMDGDSMRGILAPHFARLRPNAQLQSIEAVRVKYLPEISCIIRYDADFGDGAPASLYGKVQHSKRGKQTYDVMKALWDLPARSEGNLNVAEPLAYYPQYELLLQSEVPGEGIKSDRHSDVFMAQSEAAGRTIGYIHASGITVGAPHTVDVEINRLLNRMDEFKMSSPKVYLALRDLLRQISAKAERIPPEQPVPSHGDFKYNQFLYDGNQFALIDVEYFVQAEPSFDLGKYCGHVAPSAPKDWSDTAQANLARKVFLDAYCEIRPEYQGRRLPIYEALSLATRALVVMWAQTRNWDYTAQTLIALAYERLKARWDEIPAGLV